MYVKYQRIEAAVIDALAEEKNVLTRKLNVVKLKAYATKNSMSRKAFEFGRTATGALKHGTCENEKQRREA